VTRAGTCPAADRACPRGGACERGRIRPSSASSIALIFPVKSAAIRQSPARLAASAVAFSPTIFLGCLCSEGPGRIVDGKARNGVCVGVCAVEKAWFLPKESTADFGRARSGQIPPVRSGSMPYTLIPWRGRCV
jgi:hypothetical protein